MMRFILVLAIYLPIAFLMLSFISMLDGYDDLSIGVYILWVVVFGYAAGWLAYVTGLVDWIFK